MGFFDELLSLATGGVSDAVKVELPPALQMIPSILTGGTADIPMGVAKANKSDGGAVEKVAVFSDRSVDPGGSVDKHMREMGEHVSSKNEGLRQLAPTVGAIIGNIVYPGAGGAAGAGIGSKLKGDSYLGGGITAGASYVGGAAGNAVGGAVGNAASSTVGNTVGTAAGKVAGTVGSKIGGMIGGSMASTLAKAGSLITTA